MILRRLVEYAERLEANGELTPVMYAAVPIRWQINLTADGHLEGFLPLGGDRKDNKRGERVDVPDLVVSSGIRPKLLAQDAKYVLGIGKPEVKPERVAECHRQFVDLTRLCAEATREPTVEAVLNFLDDWNPDIDAVRLPGQFDPGDNLTFRVGGVRPVDKASVKAFWADYTANEDAPVMTCLVTGRDGPVASRLPVKIKRIPDGQSSGTSLVSADKSAFYSYNLKNSLTSPISRDAGEKFGKALNHLLADEKSRLFIGPSAYVFWTREKTGFDFASFLSRPESEDVKLLLQSPVSGKERSGIEGDDFYALALSASGGRAVVRDWLETTVPEAQENLKRWFQAQRMVNSQGEPGDPLGLFPLAAGAYRDANKEMTPQVPAALVRAAVNGGRVPEDLLARAVRRNRADGDVSRQRAALMKLVLIYGGETVAETLEELNPRVEDPAYHCGRLLAQLEELQKAAIPGVKATIVDRYYGAASSTPASVFGTLMRNHNAHIGKIRKERPGVGVAIQDRIGEITEKIGVYFPNTLTMRQQAVFALGFYHQRAHNRSEARAAREAREHKGERDSR